MLALVEGSQILPDLIVLQSILNAAFVGDERNVGILDHAILGDSGRDIVLGLSCTFSKSSLNKSSLNHANCAATRKCAPLWFGYFE